MSSWGGERTGDVTQKKLHVAIVTHLRGLIVKQFDASCYSNYNNTVKHKFHPSVTCKTSNRIKIFSPEPTKAFLEVYNVMQCCSVPFVKKYLPSAFN